MFTLAPKKKFGQNFLTDQSIIEKIVQAGGELENKNVLEIGGGTGNLTRYLLKKKPKNSMGFFGCWSGSRCSASGSRCPARGSRCSGSGSRCSGSRSGRSSLLTGDVFSFGGETITFFQIF